MRPTLRTTAVLSVAAAVTLLSASVSTGAPSGVAANSTTYIDGTADVPAGGMDITTVVASNDDAGKLTFRITFPSHPTLTVDKEIQLALDVDRNAGTGSSAGNEFAIFVEGRENAIGFYRFDPTQRNYQLIPNTGIVGRFSGNVQTIEFSRTLLGTVSTFDFELYAGPEDFPTVDDFAPNQGKWTYTILIGGGGTPPPATERVAIRSFSMTPKAPIAGESFTVSVRVARVGRSGRFDGTVYCSTLPGVQTRWFGSVSPGVASCRWDIPARAAGKRIRGSISVGEGDSPIVRRNFTARVIAVAPHVSIEGGISLSPSQPTAGQKFYYRMGIAVRHGSSHTRIINGTLSCGARIGGQRLTIFEQKIVRRSGIRCGWNVPFGTSGQTMVGTIVVRSDGGVLTHRFRKRIR